LCICAARGIELVFFSFFSSRFLFLSLVRFTLSVSCYKKIFRSITRHHRHHPTPLQVPPRLGDILLQASPRLRNVSERRHSHDQRHQSVEPEACDCSERELLSFLVVFKEAFAVSKRERERERERRAERGGETSRFRTFNLIIFLLS